MAFLERDADFNVSRTAGARRRMRQRRESNPCTGFAGPKA